MNPHDTIENDGTWRGKAHRIIRLECEREYRRANPHPSRNSYSGYKQQPYRPTQLANDLVKCLDTDDELWAKQLFLSYEGMKAIS